MDALLAVNGLPLGAILIFNAGYGNNPAKYGRRIIHADGVLISVRGAGGQRFFRLPDQVGGNQIIRFDKDMRIEANALNGLAALVGH